MRDTEAELASGAQSKLEMVAFDEEFLKRVDRAMLERKQADPYCLQEVGRAAEEESRLAGLTNAHCIDRPIDRRGLKTL
ncbi:hypothetical protein EJP69_14360 [Variovorax gossypii]|uniref:Uncharacterized protein n=1 Tax=Variovorax gossypii TaxID=1679495 RepID=A0A3S0QBH3_9BURK|nr:MULTISPECIES: hypothetical protein [Variovorax]MDR6522165.1 hypothetical protein [Variovorax paradoxus]RTQ35537.1 hypothetical protein EJP69_14360 [Variovorax gossypii]